jgi:hypothetical protein
MYHLSTMIRFIEYEPRSTNLNWYCLDMVVSFVTVAVPQCWSKLCVWLWKHAAIPEKAFSHGQLGCNPFFPDHHQRLYTYRFSVTHLGLGLES